MADNVYGRVFDSSTSGWIADLLVSVSAPTGIYVKESSLGTDFVWNAGLLDVSIQATDGSVSELYNFYEDLSTYSHIQDTSIADLYSEIENIPQDSSISDLYSIKADKTEIYSKSYIDGSLNAKVPLNKIDQYTYNTRLNPGVAVAANWNLRLNDVSSDFIFINDSVGEGIYIRGKFPRLDLLELNTSGAPTGRGRTLRIDSDSYIDASFYKIDYIDGSLNTLRTRLNTTDTSLNTLKLRVDNHDTSINLINNWNIEQDVSIAWCAANISGFPEASVNEIYSYVDGSLNLKVNKTLFDSSIVSLTDWNLSQDASLILKANKSDVDSSFGNYYNKTQIDASLGVIYTKTQVDSSFGLITNLAKSPFQTLTLANAADSSIAWSIRNGWNAKYTLTKDISLMIPDVNHGDSGTLLLIEDASGTWKMNLPANSFILSDASTITKTAGAKNFLTFVYDISTFYWNLGKNYIAQTQV